MFGYVLSVKKSPNNTNLIFLPVGPDTKTSATAVKINYMEKYNGLASSVLLDNQDAANSETVRINNGLNTITIPASAFRTFDTSWVEQISLEGASTNMQVSAQLVMRDQLGI